MVIATSFVMVLRRPLESALFILSSLSPLGWAHGAPRWQIAQRAGP
jgi:hypothetical protein